MNIQATLEKILPLLLTYGGKIIGTIAAFFIGRKIIAKILTILTTQMAARNVDRDLRPFLTSISSALLNVTLILLCANIIGIETTSFVAILSAAGLAVGFALQGSLSNFASGVLLLVFKPYRVGDIINIQGVTGKVNAIRIFDTVIVTPDNKTIVVPNGKIFSGNIINHTAQGSIRVDMVFAASNQHEAEDIRNVIGLAVQKCPFLLTDRANDIMIAKLNDKAIQFDVSLWTNAHTYWEAYYYMNEAVYREFKKAGINAQGIIK
jgi:small conductance mechanosensitive channel